MKAYKQVRDGSIRYNRLIGVHEEIAQLKALHYDQGVKIRTKDLKDLRKRNYTEGEVALEPVQVRVLSGRFRIFEVCEIELVSYRAEDGTLHILVVTPDGYKDLTYHTLANLYFPDGPASHNKQHRISLRKSHSELMRRLEKSGITADPQELYQLLKKHNKGDGSKLTLSTIIYVSYPETGSYFTYDVQFTLTRNSEDEPCILIQNENQQVATIYIPLPIEMYVEKMRQQRPKTYVTI